MKVNSEVEMIALGQTMASQVTFPAVFELIGDVGTGKTTFTRGLAEGLGVAETVTSPSFTISKRYGFLRKGKPVEANLLENSTPETGELVHYDFYRLNDPGIMRDELAETLTQSNTVVVVEWGGDVAELLPETKYQLQLTLNEDGSRSVELNSAAQALTRNNLEQTL